MTKEVTIAGGGLAGLSLASALAGRGVPVTVLEAGRYPRHRVCGEFISGLPETVLENLGIANLFADAKLHRTVRWNFKGRPFFAASLPEAALGISRHRLDDRLRRQVIDRGGVVREGERVPFADREGFVWAVGRQRVGGRGKWIGLKVHARVEPLMNADLEMRIGSNGYTGLTRVEDGWINVCGLFRAPDQTGLPSGGADLLPTLIERGGDPNLAEALRSAERRPGSYSAMAGFEFGRQPASGHAAAIGDAERMIPPFTGHGMAMAFLAAESALDPITRWAHGLTSWRDATAELRSTMQRRFARRMLMARLFHPWILSNPGQSILAACGRHGVLPFRLLCQLVH